MHPLQKGSLLSDPKFKEVLRVEGDNNERSALSPECFMRCTQVEED